MKQQRLDISDDLSLPAQEMVTQTTVVYGGKGMGKTNLGAVIMEELARASKRFCFIDPVGVAWGIRHSADGKGEGVKVVILGGRHGDLPIEPSGGAVVADFVSESAENILIDISSRADGRRWSTPDKIKFVADYLTRLLERNGEHRRPLLQIIDEAARYAPQQIAKHATGAADCLAALEVLVEEGRNAGLGVMLLTQRSARMAKSVSELAELMVAFRTIGPNSVEAILDWFGEHVPKERWKTLVDEIRKLPVGSALIVSPGWLKFEGIARIRKRDTLDSSKTPTGTEQKLAKRVKPADLEALRARIAATVEKAEAEDPRKLQSKTATLQRDVERLTAEIERLRAKPAPAGRAAAAPPALTDADRDFLRKLSHQLEHAREDVRAQVRILVSDSIEAIDKAKAEIIESVEIVGRSRLKELDATFDKPRLAAILGKLESNAGSSQLVSAGAARPTAPLTPIAPRPPRVDAGPGDASIGKTGLCRMLIALAQRPQGLTRAQLGMRASVSSKGGSFDTYLSKARVNGWIASEGHTIRITSEGLTALGSYEPLPTGRALADHYIAEFGNSGAARMLRVLVDNHPKAFTRQELGEAASVSASGGSFDTYLSRLRTMELVEGKDGVKASAEFFS